MIENFLSSAADLKALILFVALIAAVAYVAAKIVSPCPTGLFCRLLGCDPCGEDDYTAYELGYYAGWHDGERHGYAYGQHDGWDAAVELETGLERVA